MLWRLIRPEFFTECVVREGEGILQGRKRQVHCVGNFPLRRQFSWFSDVSPSISRVAVRGGKETNDDFIFWILRDLVYLQIRLEGRG